MSDHLDESLIEDLAEDDDAASACSDGGAAADAVGGREARRPAPLDESLIEDLAEDDHAASSCSDGGAAADAAGGREVGRPAPQWEPLRLGGALPPCLAIWPEEVDAVARKTALDVVAAEAAAAAAAQRCAGRNGVLKSPSPRAAGGGGLSFSSANREWGARTDAADDFEEVRSLCSDDGGLEEERASCAARCIHKALDVAWVEEEEEEEAQQPEEEPEAACDEVEEGVTVVEHTETTTEDLAFDLVCGVVDLGIASCKGGDGEPAAVAAAQEQHQAAPWGSTARQPAHESVLERLRAEFPQACARTAGVVSVPGPAAASATPAAPWGSAARQPAEEGVLERLQAEFPQACARAAGAASVPEPAAPTATPAPPTPSCKAKRRVVIGGVVRAPAGSPAEEASVPEGGARASSQLCTAQRGDLSRSRLSPASTSALALDLGEGAGGKSKWATGADWQQSESSPGLRTSPSLGALKVTKKEHARTEAPSWRAALGPAGGVGSEPSWARKQAMAASNLPMGGGSVAFNLRMARLTALQGQSREGVF